MVGSDQTPVPLWDAVKFIQAVIQGSLQLGLVRGEMLGCRGEFEVQALEQLNSRPKLESAAVESTMIQ